MEIPNLELLVQEPCGDKKMDKYHIRWMIRRDMQEVLEIESLSFEYPWCEEDFIMCLRQRNCIGMVIEIGEYVVGYVIYELAPTHLSVLNIAVHPDWRRQGCGKAMLDKMKGKLSQQRRTSLYLIVRETNLSTHLFLRSQNLKCIEILRDFYEVDEGCEDGYHFRFRTGYDNIIPHNRIGQFYEDYQRK